MQQSRGLQRRLEEAALNGWPALRQTVYGGLLLRFSDGYTRRANSVNAVGPLGCDAVEAIRFCEAAYRAQHLPTIFRQSSALDIGLGAALDRAGYAPPEDETLVLYRDIGAAAFPSEDLDSVTSDLGQDWLDALARVQGQTDRDRRIHRLILQVLTGPAGFAAIHADGAIVSLCFGAVHDGIVCINSVATDSRYRRRGLSRRAIGAVLAWAVRQAGASLACVPVQADNAPAVALYRSLGFDREGLRYHYRRRHPC